MDFRRFVKATGHVTVAERPLDRADYGLYDMTGTLRPASSRPSTPRPGTSASAASFG